MNRYLVFFMSICNRFSLTISCSKFSFELLFKVFPWTPVHSFPLNSCSKFSFEHFYFQISLNRCSQFLSFVCKHKQHISFWITVRHACLFNSFDVNSEQVFTISPVNLWTFMVNFFNVPFLIITVSLITFYCPKFSISTSLNIFPLFPNKCSHFFSHWLTFLSL